MATDIQAMTQVLRNSPSIGEQRNAEAGLIKAANGGDSEAMYRLGYLHGISSFEISDPSSAKNWFERGASLNHAGCLYMLGYGYESGLFGLPLDVEKSKAMYVMASGLGDLDAKYALGSLMWRYASNNREKRIAINHIETAAKLGHESALPEYSEGASC